VSDREIDREDAEMKGFREPGEEHVKLQPNQGGLQSDFPNARELDSLRDRR
jgi:hypothetical protein